MVVSTPMYSNSTTDQLIPNTLYGYSMSSEYLFSNINGCRPKHLCVIYDALSLSLIFSLTSNLRTYQNLSHVTGLHVL